MLKEAIENTIKYILSGQIIYSDSVKQSTICTDGFTALYTPSVDRHLELALLIEGQAGIQISDTVFPLSPDKLIVILPNTMHCEGCFTREFSYKILWIIFIGRGTHFLISEHRRNKKRITTERFFVGHASENNPWSICCDSMLSKDHLLQAKFCSILLSTCVRAIESLKKTESSWPIQQQKLLSEVEHYIKDHCREKVTLKELSSFSGYTPNYLGALFLRYAGQTVHQYILNMRLKLASEMILSSDYQIKEISFSLGFKDPLYFSRLFHSKFGQSPSDFKKKGKVNNQ